MDREEDVDLEDFKEVFGSNWNTSISIENFEQQPPESRLRKGFVLTKLEPHLRDKRII